MSTIKLLEEAYYKAARGPTCGTLANTKRGGRVRPTPSARAARVRIRAAAVEMVAMVTLVRSPR
jgi:hypothetical protein